MPRLAESVGHSILFAKVRQIKALRALLHASVVSMCSAQQGPVWPEVNVDLGQLTFGWQSAGKTGLSMRSTSEMGIEPTVPVVRAWLTSHRCPRPLVLGDLRHDLHHGHEAVNDARDAGPVDRARAGAKGWPVSAVPAPVEGRARGGGAYRALPLGHACSTRCTAPAGRAGATVGV